jgi:hypothetical protein
MRSPTNGILANAGIPSTDYACKSSGKYYLMHFQKQNVEGKDWAKGGINQEDNTTEGFLALLKHLRIVLL